MGATEIKLPLDDTYMNVIHFGSGKETVIGSQSDRPGGSGGSSSRGISAVFSTILCLSVREKENPERRLSR